jgi:hypothetical protein
VKNYKLLERMELLKKWASGEELNASSQSDVNTNNI